MYGCHGYSWPFFLCAQMSNLWNLKHIASYYKNVINYFSFVSSQMLLSNKKYL